MKNTPQINNFLNIGIKRFADRGIDGIRIDEICDEVGVAKSSFYHYFGNKEGFIDQLFEYWYIITTDSVYDKIKHIDDAVERFSALKELIDSNVEVEYCFLQMKLFALTNEKAREVVDRAKQKRFDVLFEIFKMAGQSDEEAAINSKMMILLYFGHVALNHGYSSSTSRVNITNEHILKFLGLEKS